MPNKNKDRFTIVNGKKEDEPTRFGIVLIERPGCAGLTLGDMKFIYNRLEADEGFPIEISDVNGNSTAMGIISPRAAEILDYEYDQNSQLGQYIANILDDMGNESPNGEYMFNGIDILLTR